jgi:hypothetical protein
MKMALQRVVRVPVRETRGGTPNLQDVARRGEGGVRLPIGGGRWAMMTTADAALTEAQRAEIVDARQRPTITEFVPGEAKVAPTVETPRVARPEMIDDSNLSFRVARGVVLGSLTKGRRVAAEINEKNPGSNLRIPTEEEVVMINRALGDQLEGRDCWIWTDTEHEDHPGNNVLRHQGSGYRYSFYPGSDYDNRRAVRLVEDK